MLCYVAPLFQGAPETIQDMLIDLPSAYVNTYKKYTRQGSRVLALAYKSLPEMTVRVLPFLDSLLEIPLVLCIFFFIPPPNFRLLMISIFIDIGEIYCAYGLTK